MKKNLLLMLIALSFFIIADCSLNQGETINGKETSNQIEEYNLLDKDELIQACNDAAYMKHIMEISKNRHNKDLTRSLNDSTTYVWGDANQDGYADVLDALLVAQYTVGTSSSEITEYLRNGMGSKYCNIDLYSSVTIVDALLIVQYYVGLIVSIPQVPAFNSSDFAPGDVFIKFYEYVDINEFLESYNDVVLSKNFGNNLFVVVVPVGEENEYIHQFYLNELVKYAEPNYIYVIDA